MANIRQSRQYTRLNEDCFRTALSLCQNGNFPSTSGPKIFDVPKIKLQKNSLLLNKSSGVKALGRPPILNQYMESLLVEQSAIFKEQFFRLTRKDLQKMAFDLAEMFSIRNTFNRQTRMASPSWLYGFLKRNKANEDLVIPKRQSLVKWQFCSSQNILNFLSVLEKYIIENRISKESIFVLSEIKQVFMNTPNGRVELKVVFAIGSNNVTIPPLIIVNGQTGLNETFFPPNGFIFEVSKNGEISEDIFINWLKIIKPIMNPNKYQTTLLLLDGQYEYCKNLRTLIFAKNNGILLLQIIGYQLQNMLPYYDTFVCTYNIVFDIFESNYPRAFESPMVTTRYMGRIISHALKEATHAIYVNNIFAELGIWPYNKNVFFHYLYNSHKEPTMQTFFSRTVLYHHSETL